MARTRTPAYRLPAPLVKTTDWVGWLICWLISQIGLDLQAVPTFGASGAMPLLQQQVDSKAHCCLRDACLDSGVAVKLCDGSLVMLPMPTTSLTADLLAGEDGDVSCRTALSYRGKGPDDHDEVGVLVLRGIDDTVQAMLYRSLMG